MQPDPARHIARLHRLDPLDRRGRVVEAVGTTVRVTGLAAQIGQFCEIVEPGGVRVAAEVVGIAGGAAILTPLTPLAGLSPNAEARLLPGASRVPAGERLFGRVLSALGVPLDDGPPLADGPTRPVHAEPPNPLHRAPIDQPFATGVRALDALVTMGVGQRIGVFAAAGGGKSTLLGMLARHAETDAIVVGLIGERGREVREFLEDSLGPHGVRRSVVVVATSDRPAMERVRAAHAATAIAEGFRAEGKRVLLLMDSVTRFARALREIGLAAGEPAVRRGFPPSVFAELPRLFERAGNDRTGSITAIYTVLLEDEEGDPIGEEVRSILDGHIHLSRKLGAAGHYPAIDVGQSLSRLFPRVAPPEQRAAAAHVRALIAKYAEVEFLLQVGEYAPGHDALADEAIERRDAINAFLRQDAHARSDRAATLAELAGLAA